MSEAVIGIGAALVNAMVQLCLASLFVWMRSHE